MKTYLVENVPLHYAKQAKKADLCHFQSPDRVEFDWRIRCTSVQPGGQISQEGNCNDEQSHQEESLANARHHSVSRVQAKY